jgi:hypothetical protein
MSAIGVSKMAVPKGINRDELMPQNGSGMQPQEAKDPTQGLRQANKAKTALHGHPQRMLAIHNYECSKSQEITVRVRKWGMMRGEGCR